MTDLPFNPWAYGKPEDYGYDPKSLNDSAGNPVAPAELLRRLSILRQPRAAFPAASPVPVNGWLNIVRRLRGNGELSLGPES